MLKHGERVTHRHRKRSNKIILGIVGVGFVILLILGIYIIRFLKNFDQNKDKQQQIEQTVQN